MIIIAMGEGNAIISSDQESLAQKPAYVEYFDAMHNLLEAIPPDDRGYQNILVYDGVNDQPVVKFKTSCKV